MWTEGQGQVKINSLDWKMIQNTFSYLTITVNTDTCSCEEKNIKKCSQTELCKETNGMEGYNEFFDN